MNLNKAYMLLALTSACNLLIGQDNFIYLSRGDNALFTYDKKLNIKKQFKDDILLSYDMVLDSANQLIYITDGEKKAVNSIKFKQNAFSKVKLDKDVKIVDIELNHSDQSIFLLDFTSRSILKVADVNNGKEITIIDSLDHPSAITISEKNNYLFWAELQLKSIYRSDLDGNNKELIYQDSAHYPVRLLAVDKLNKIFWCDDGNHRIWAANYDGTNASIVFNGNENNFPFGLLADTINNFIYWTDYGSEEIWKADFTGANAESVYSSDNNDLIAVGLINTDIVPPPLALRSLKSVNLFPNPAHDWITFHLPITRGEIATIEIFSSTGKLVLRRKTQDHTYKLDLSSDLTHGAYLYRVIIAKESFQGLLMIH